MEFEDDFYAIQFYKQCILFSYLNTLIELDMDNSRFPKWIQNVFDKTVQDIINDEPEFVKFLNELFEKPDCKPEDSLTYLINLLNGTDERPLETFSKYPSIHNDKYVKLTLKFCRFFNLNFFHSTEITSAQKIEIANIMLNNIEYAEYTNIENVDEMLESSRVEKIFLKKEIERLRIITNTEKKQNELFKVDISILERHLFEERLILNCGNKLASLLSVDWIMNKPILNWEGKQTALLYLFYNLNNNKREIVKGSITTLISKTFTYKNMQLSERNLTKLLSNVIDKFCENHYQKPEYILQIDRIIALSKYSEIEN